MPYIKPQKTQKLRDFVRDGETKLSLLSENFEIKEDFETSSTGEIQPENHKVYLVGKALTFDTPTRNKVAYTHKSGMATLNTWEGRPFLNCHKDDNVLNSIGHIEKMEVKSDDKGKPSLWYKVDIDPEEEEFIHKVKRRDIPYVSVQVLVSDVRQKESMEFGNYIEADIKEGLELSSVLIPGERETFGYITEERLFESFCNKEELTDKVEDDKKKTNPIIKKDSGYVPNQAIVAPKEDISTVAGNGLIQPALLTKKIKKAPEPDNKIIPDLIPRRMVSMQSLDKDNEKKTNVADETQGDQEVGFTFDGKTLKYWKKGGNNIPGVPLKGFKAESLSTFVNCCNKPMIVMRNNLKGLALHCNKCNRTIVRNEKFWKCLSEQFKIKKEGT